MQTDPTRNCGKCIERDQRCDRARPVCNTCIRDGLLCSGFESPQCTPGQSPTPRSPSIGIKESSQNPLLHAISVIVSTPLWTEQAPDHRVSYFEHRRDPEKTSQDQFVILPQRSVIPKSIPPDPGVVSNALPFISHQYDRMIKHMAFGIPPPSIMEKVLQRLSFSVIAFSSMTLGARILQAMIDAMDDTDWRTYEKPIDNLHWQACSTPAEGSSLICTRGRLTAAIELTAYKFFISNNTLGYAFLKRTAPLVNYVALHYPQIWTKHGKISAQKMLNQGYLELSSFVWADTMASTLLGTAPLLCYDTSICDQSKAKRVLEWMNGCPQEFVVWFSRLNTLRVAKRHGVNALPLGWETIERIIQELQPTTAKTEISRDNVARQAVVEGWKTALLIYLYVAVYGVTSADSRVQVAVKQIIRLHQLVKHRAAFGRHLLAPAIFAGACARLESHRQSVMAILSSRRRDRMWVLQISDFVFVLQHLWHGVAKDGRSITWDDYIHSRRAVLPIGE